MSHRLLRSSGGDTTDMANNPVNGASFEATSRSNTVARAADQAQARIIRVLGRQPVTQIRLGRTDKPLGEKPVTHKGFTVQALYTATNTEVAAAVEEKVASWIKSCHGGRFEVSAAPLLASGTKHLYLGVR